MMALERFPEVTVVERVEKGLADAFKEVARRGIKLKNIDLAGVPLRYFNLDRYHPELAEAQREIVEFIREHPPKSAESPKPFYMRLGMDAPPKKPKKRSPRHLP